ncbi:hypothetical protein [Winogradskyella sp.]|uniref:hypothetical protein n=1 Tax=Winogradskyella sp. TaxID=1883156 RepID=UPI003BA97FFF
MSKEVKPTKKPNSKKADELLDFVDKTKKGAFTREKPDLTYIVYKQIDIQEQDSNYDEHQVLHFGFTI